MTEPLNADRCVTLHCGLGRDSIAMVCLLLEGRLVVDGRARGPAEVDAVVFADTGSEWPATRALVPVVRDLCERHGLRFELVAKGDAEHLRPALLADFRSRRTVASLAKGDCTENHKILPLRRRLGALARERFGVESGRAWGAAVRRGERRPHLTLVGIAADETARLAKGGRSPSYVEERYPLVEAGVTKADEAAILARWGLGHVRKSGCYCCPYQPVGWYWALSVQHPDLWAEVVAYEATALDRNPRMSVTGIKVAGAVLTLPEVVERWRARNPSATVAAVLDKSYTRCLGEARAARRDAEAELVSLGRGPRQLELGVA